MKERVTEWFYDNMVGVVFSIPVLLLLALLVLAAVSDATVCKTDPGWNVNVGPANVHCSGTEEQPQPAQAGPRATEDCARDYAVGTGPCGLLNPVAPLNPLGPQLNPSNPMHPLNPMNPYGFNH